MYSIKQVLKQEPATVVGVVNLWLAFLVTVGVIDVSAETIASFGGALNATFLLFYVRTLVSSNDALKQLGEAMPSVDQELIRVSDWGSAEPT